MKTKKQNLKLNKKKQETYKYILKLESFKGYTPIQIKAISKTKNPEKAGIIFIIKNITLRKVKGGGVKKNG